MSNIVINGTEYTGVESISVNTTDGGTATYTDNAIIQGSLTSIENKVTQLESKVDGKASTDYVDTKIADLVNSAPETLDTLGEVANAISENEDVVSALNSSIGNKADKTYVDGIKTELEEQIASSGGSSSSPISVISGTWSSVSGYLTTNFKKILRVIVEYYDGDSQANMIVDLRPVYVRNSACFEWYDWDGGKFNLYGDDNGFSKIWDNSDSTTIYMLNI